MPSFGKTSKKRLKTCHPLIQLIMNKVIEDYDCTILCGYRGLVEQNKAFNTGKSKVMWPDSNHNKEPSLAIDVGPWPLDWKDIAEFKHLAGRILATANIMGIKLNWGGNWKSFIDCPHFQRNTKINKKR